MPVQGGLAQLARAPALQAGGQRFESVILHIRFPLRASDTLHDIMYNLTSNEGKRCPLKEGRYIMHVSLRVWTGTCGVETSAGVT